MRTRSYRSDRDETREIHGVTEPPRRQPGVRRPEAAGPGRTCQIERGERLCLLGRNGEGKSTLLRLIDGELAPDEGEVIRQQGLRIARLPQEVPDGPGRHRRRRGGRGLAEPGRPAPGHDHRVDAVLSRMGLDADARFDDLSSGMKRRVLLARSLVADPDILLLDEPTNHLDIDAIRWLEDFLLRYGGTLVFVTHDRVFLERLATRIIELDRGRLCDWACDYPTFLKRTRRPARRRGPAERPLRQEARPGGGLDPQGHPGPPDPQRGARPGPEGAARGPHQAPRAAGHGADPGAGGRAVGDAGHRGQGGRLRLRRPPGDPRPDDDDHAGRQGRDHRPQRLGQDDPAPPPARRARRRRRGRSATARTWRSPTSTS